MNYLKTPVNKVKVEGGGANRRGKSVQGRRGGNKVKGRVRMRKFGKEESEKI